MTSKPIAVAPLLLAGIADVVTLGDSWLTPAIQRRLIQPISSAETYRWWQRLPRRWQQLVRRDNKTGLPSESGEIWGCPYRWVGCRVPSMFTTFCVLLLGVHRQRLVRRDSKTGLPSEAGDIWGCPYRLVGCRVSIMFTFCVLL